MDEDKQSLRSDELKKQELKKILSPEQYKVAVAKVRRHRFLASMFLPETKVYIDVWFVAILFFHPIQSLIAVPAGLTSMSPSVQIL